MQFSRENRELLYGALMLPVFLFYLDTAFIVMMRSLHNGYPHIYRLLELIDPWINIVSHGSTLILIGCVFFIAGRFYNKVLYQTGRSLVIGFVLAGGAAQLLKHLIGRARPRLTDKLMVIGPTLKSGYDSFPSGHSSVAFCFAFILSQYFPRYRIPFYLAAAVVGFERVEDISHFPSDVIAGALLGLFAGRLILSRAGRRESTASPAREK